MTIEAYSAVTVSDVSNNPIVSVDVLYNLSSSNTTPPSANDANWKTEADQWEDGKYFWQKTITTFEHGEPLVSEPVCITGGKGETGVGIKSIKEQYYKSTSSSNLSGGSWTTTPPVWEDGYYIWTRSQIIYTDGSTGYTDHILNQYYKSITDRVLSVESTVDKQEGIIKDKVSVTEFEEKIGEYDGKIETINTTVAEHTTSIGNITSQVNTLETTVSDNKTTMDEKIAKLELTDSNITSTVSNVKTQLDNLEVGGRNLIVQSKTSVGWVNDKGVVTGTGYMTSDYISVEPGDVIILQLWMPTSIRVWVDDTYFDSTKTYIGYYGGEYITTDHVTKEYIVPNGASYVRVSYSWADGYKVKLEKGTLPTDWTPAPEDTAEEISSVRTIAEQTADKFEWIVESGDSSTNFTLTDRTATLVANYINLNGLVTFNGLDDDTSEKIDTAYSWTNSNGSNMTSLRSMVLKWTDNAVSDTTEILGGWIKTNTITSNHIVSGAIITEKIQSGAITTDKISTDALQSIGYTNNDSYARFSEVGTFFNLADGSITSKNFAIDESGNAYFRGNIESTSGTIANWNIYDYYLDGLYESTTEYTDHIIALSSILYSDKDNKIALDLQEKIYGWVNGVYMEETFVPSTDGDGNYAQPVIALYSKKYTNANKTTLEQTKRNFIIYGNGRLICQDGLVEIGSDGKFTAKDAEIYGDIKANSITALDEYRIYYTLTDIFGEEYGTSSFSNPIMRGKYDDTTYTNSISTSVIIGDNLDKTDNAYINIHTIKPKDNLSDGEIDLGINLKRIYLHADSVDTDNQILCKQLDSSESITTPMLSVDDIKVSSNITTNGITATDLWSTNATFEETVKCLHGISLIGTNTYSSAKDTVDNWALYNNSVHYYNNSGTLKSKPSTYGFLSNYSNGSIVHQLWLGMPNGMMYHRSGNTNGWGGTTDGDGSWKTVLDSSNYTSYRHDRLISGNYGTRVYITGGSPYFIPTNSSGSYSDGTTHLGGSAARWKNIYATNGTIQTSDANEKCSIKDIDEIYEQFFMKLRGVTYMWNKRSEYDTQIHDRIHCGLIAQEVNEAAESVGLSSLTAAVICRDDLDEPTYDGRTERWGLAYSELHGLEIHMIQKSIRHQEEQDKKIKQLETQIEELTERLNKLEQKG